MNYSVQNLTSVADCDALLFKASRKRSDLNYQREGDQRQVNRFGEISQQLTSELVSVLAQISACDYTIANLPDGPEKEKERDEKTRLEYRKFTIETRMESYGTVALLEKEMTLGQVLKEIEEVDLFIETVTARKAEIPVIQ